jgi:hypothetical protein
MADNEEDYSIRLAFFIPLVILNVFMLLISLFFFFLLVKSKAFGNYQCYNIIIFSLAILLDSVVRIIPFTDDDPNNLSFFEYFQAFLLTFLDKVILAAITTQTLLFYLGVIHTKTFKNNDKKAFFISFVINIVICSSLSILYIYFGGIRLANHRRYLYCDTSELKDISDPIFDSVYLIANLYCSIILIKYLFRKIKEIEKGITEDYDYKHNFKKAIIVTLLNIIIFLESYLIIFGILKEEKADIIYLSTLLLISLFNCCNETVMKEAMKIFCKNKYKQRYGNDEKGNENDEEGDENDEKLVKTNTYIE